MKFSRRGITAATAISAVLFIGACGGDPVAGPSGPTDTTSTGPTTTTASAGSSAPKCPNGQLDHCFTRGQMQQFADAIIPMVRDFYRGFKSPAKIYYIADGQAGHEDCLGEDGQPALSSTKSYEYCPADQKIYLGQTALWNYYSTYGAVAPAIGLAHEWGHHLQQLAGVPEPTTAAGIVILEDQADCAAGAWTGYMRGKGLDATDLPNIDQFIPSLGSTEHPGRTHGTAPERVRSYNLGFNSGLKACNAYFPTHPITT